jgi:hypothetical protein
MILLRFSILLFLATTALMTTPTTFGVSIGASIAAIIFAFFLDSITNGNYTEARFTGAFHSINCSHGFFLIASDLSLIYEQIFRY